jgi:hypothetical protein
MRNSLIIYGWLVLLTLHGMAAQPRPEEAHAERSSLDLSGEWEFKMDPLDVGRAEKWFEEMVPY